MSSRPKITARITSLAGAFVHAIIPRHVDRNAQIALFGRVGVEENECVYCGNRATDQDHFKALVRKGRPSGHFHTIHNLVPACGPCNQSKGGTDWKKWMNGSARGSPRTRGVADLTERIERLSKFEAEAAKVARLEEDELRAAASPELWDEYWKRLDSLKVQLAEAQALAERIRANVDLALGIDGQKQQG